MAERLSMLIADIGGYTRFMSTQRYALAHAQELIASLLESVIDAAGPLKLAKLEGDAAFLYAPSNVLNGAALARTVAAVRGAFLAKQRALQQDRMCTCEACVHLGDLSLKFVAHSGEAAFQKVKRHTELAGIDVILVHRMLKNTVPISEYVLMTDPLHSELEDPVRSLAETVAHEFEGIGPTQTHYIDLNRLPAPAAADVSPNAWRKLWSKLSLELRSMPYVLGVKKACEGYRNVEVAKE